MADKLSTARIKVKEPSKYGFKDMDDKLWGLHSSLKKEQFVPGGEYDVTYYTSPAGNKYIREFKTVSAGSSSPTPAPAAPTAAPAPGKGDAAKPDAEYWNNRNASIECQAVVKAVLGSPTLAALCNGDFESSKELADQMFAWGMSKVRGAN